MAWCSRPQATGAVTRCTPFKVKASTSPDCRSQSLGKRVRSATSNATWPRSRKRRMSTSRTLLIPGLMIKSTKAKGCCTSWNCQGIVQQRSLSESKSSTTGPGCIPSQVIRRPCKPNRNINGSGLFPDYPVHEIRVTPTQPR